MTATLNTTITPVHTVTERDREITHRFMLKGTEVTDNYGETFTAALDVSVRHDRERRGYVLSHTRVRVGEGTVRWHMEFRDEDPCPVIPYIIAEYAPRYSAKSLQRIADARMAEIESTPGLLDALIDWASRAKV